MGIGDILMGLKDKVLDAATYELLRRNFDLLEENNQQLKERLDLLKEEAETLKAEVLALRKKNADLQALVKEAELRDEFIEEQGLAFQKNPDGTVKPTAFCPECKRRLTTVDHHIYICNSCNYTTHVRAKGEAIAEYINNRLKPKL